MPNYYPLFILATALLILTPGPNVALIVANSVAHGARYGLLTVAGTSAAVLVHLVFVGIGMGEGLASVGAVFEWVRWAGVAYLLYLGITTWFAPPDNLAGVVAAPGSGRSILVRALLVSLTNPKTLLFYGAFFPQFIAPDRPLAPQLWILCATFLGVAIGIDVLWALGAARARRMIAGHGRLRQRISGGLLTLAGLGLAFARPR
ncbi:MAG: LysE family translocator [Janthinobacterium lividum]